MKYPTCRQLFLKVEGKRRPETCELLEVILEPPNIGAGVGLMLDLFSSLQLH
jgi:hypothetical protein